MKDLTAYRGGYGRFRGRKRWKLRKREWITERALNSGVFLNLPNPELEDRRWEAEVEARIEHARGVLVEFRDLLRAGKPLPDLDAEASQKNTEILNRLMDKLEGENRA